MITKDGVNKYCPKCIENKKICEFNKSQQRGDGLRVYCRQCERKMYLSYSKTEIAINNVRERQRRFRNSEHGKEYHSQYKKTPRRAASDLEYSRRAYANPELRMKIKARLAVNYAIKIGKIIRQACAVCGRSDRIHAHHDDYKKPLDVRFLCFRHHREHHEANP